MNQSALDLKSFYSQRTGNLVKRILRSHIKKIWPDISGTGFAGYGYALPYMKLYREQTERQFCILPAGLGAHLWPFDKAGHVCIAQESSLPFETESLDRMLIIHALEHTEFPLTFLEEVWRVLRSNGRMILIVPNRLGLWARADWTAFGSGVPFTQGQIRKLLSQSKFVEEYSSHALFMPPLRSFLALRTAYIFESFGQFVMPGLAGVHIIEASKQVYGGLMKKNVVFGNKRGYFVADPVAN
jgi:SAM-dependent methyltransferase